MITICAWCQRRITDGVAFGPTMPRPLWPKNISHGACNDCAEDFENGLTNETIAARARARLERVDSKTKTAECG